MRQAPITAPAVDIVAGDSVRLQRQRALQRALDELYFTAYIAAGVASYGGGIGEAMNGNATCIRIPVAGGNASIMTPTRRLFPRTQARITVTYTSPVGSTALFNFRFLFWTFGPGVLSTVGAGSQLIAWTAPGPAVASDILTTTAIVTAAKIPQSPVGAHRFMIQRFPVADANLNDLDIIMATVTLEEAA